MFDRIWRKKFVGVVGGGSQAPSSFLLPTTLRKDSSYNRGEQSLGLLGFRRRLLVLVFGCVLVGLVIVYGALSLANREELLNYPTTKRLRLPVEDFETAQRGWPNLRNLIILPGHAIQWCGEEGRDVYDESCWYLESFQHGQVPLFIEHVRRAVEELKGDPQALLVFSGGQTRPGVGPRSEAQSLVALAEHLGFFGTTSNIYHRVTTDEYARDSLENVAFSVCRFREVTGNLPEMVTVVGFPFKQTRFEELHREAVGVLPLSRFRYIGVELEGFDQSGLADSAYAGFKEDLYGCGAELAGKRDRRNPLKRPIPYPLSCPELADFFKNHCPPP